MKKFKKIALIIGITFTILITAPFIALSISPIQRAVGTYATDFLTDFIGAKFSIGRVKLHHLTRIDIDSVYVEDRQHTKMLYIGSLSAHFRLFPLLHKEISVKKVVIDDFDANIYYLPDSTMNLQFLIDAFTPKEKKGIPNLELPHIILSNADIDYSDWRKNRDFHIRDFNTDVKFSLKNKHWIDLEIASLQLSDEHSKRINNIQLKFSNDDKALNITNFIVDLPNSHVFLKKAAMTIEKHEDSTIDWDESSYDIDLAPSYLVLSDLDWILPKFSSMDKPINLQIVAKGKINNFDTKTIKVDYNNEIVLDASIRATNITDIAASNNVINFNKLQFSANSVSDLIASVTNKPLNLPKELNRVGKCTYQGQISGNPFDLSLVGSLNTAVGSISTNVTLQTPDTFKSAAISGLVQTSNINLHTILPDTALGLGNVQLAINTNAKFYKNHDFDIEATGNVRYITFKNYTYHNIEIDGTIKPNLFEGEISIDDPNGHLDFYGTCDLHDDQKTFNFNANIDSIRPNHLNLIKSYPDLSLSCKISSNISAGNIMTPNGTIDIDSLVINNSDKQYMLSNLNINTVNNTDTNFIDIKSALINGRIYGKYDLNDILGNINSTFSKDLHILNNLDLKRPDSPVAITTSFEISPLENLMNVLGIAWHTTEPSTIHVSYNSNKDRFSSFISIPQITNGKTSIDSTFLNINNYRGVSVRFKTATDLKMGHLSTNVNLRVLNDTIFSSLIWSSNSNSANNPFEGEVYTMTNLSVSDGHLNSHTSILPTQFILNNTLWHFSPSSINTSKGKISIGDFSLSSDDDQLISATGDISDNPSSKLKLNINNILLDYISEMLPKKVSISFGGLVSANGEISDISSEVPHINATVHSDNFSFNNALYGSVDGNCHFDKTNNSLNFTAMVSNSNDSIVNLDGKYIFRNKFLDITGKANGMDLCFLDYYLGQSFATVKGKAYGDVHIYGSGKEIAIDVDALAKDASLRVNFLGSSFHFTDSIHMDKDIIDFGLIDLTDDNGRHGRLNGHITHHYLKNMGFNIAIQVDTMNIMNTTRKESPSFFGNVIASGMVLIGGTDKEITITGKAKSEPGTHITLPLDNYSANENSFITFCKPISVNKGITETEAPSSGGSNLIIDLMLDISPETEASLIINSKSGDQLNAKAGGSLRFTYDVNANDMKMYGSIQVVEAKYLFTLQEVIRKEFIIKEGGTLSWSGDILSASLDLEGSYRLNADLAELLDESVLANVTRTTVPVECQIDITGILTQPNIGFSIYLPNSEEELNRAVKNTINTTEMLNREVIALLLMGKFIRPETMNNNSFLSQNELYAVVSSTISAQINNLASQMFDKWGFGVNFSTAGEGASRENEYEFKFQYAPTSRLVINGNVGYRNNNASNNNFIGDFDIEYKVIPSGKLRIKGYTHTNDYKEFKKGLTTQGVGLVWSESFLNAKDLRDSWKANHERSKRERAERKAERQKKKEEKEKLKRERKSK